MLHQHIADGVRSRRMSLKIFVNFDSMGRIGMNSDRLEVEPFDVRHAPRCDQYRGARDLTAGPRRCVAERADFVGSS